MPCWQSKLGNSISETPARLASGTGLPANWWCGNLHFPVDRLDINMDIPYCMTSVFLAYRYRNLPPISFSPFLRTHPLHDPSRVEPDQTTCCVCSLQRPAASQRCASPSRWRMKRRGPPRSITLLPRIIKVMLWSVIFFYHLPTGLERRRR